LTDRHRGHGAILGLAAFVIAADRLTKMAAEAWLDPLRPIPVIPGFFDLTLVRNPGGVFGVLRDLSEGVRGAIFTIVPSLVIVAIAFYAWRLPREQRLTRAALALVLGGAIGNLIDRIKLGHVVDFLDVYWREHHWPAFNIADSAICTGVALMLYEGLFVRSHGAEGTAPPGAGGDAP
jgi:signal peptidase II